MAEANPVLRREKPAGREVATASKKRHGASGTNRSLPRGGQAKVSYQSLSKAGGLVVSRSALESDALALLEMDPFVLSFERNDLRPQERVRYTLGRIPPENEVFELTDGQMTPNIRVHLQGGGTVYLDVGPYGAKTTEPYRSHLEEAMTLARRAGTALLLVTEREVRRGHRLSNVQRLLPYLHRIVVGRELVNRALTLLEERPWLIDGLVSELRSASDATIENCTEAAWAAVAEGTRAGRLLFNLDAQPIDAASRLRLAAKGDGDAFVA